MFGEREQVVCLQTLRLLEMHGHFARQAAASGHVGKRGVALAGLNPEVWDGRKVLLTGHTGFKGSWLAQVLQKMGAKVSGYALAPNTQPNHFELLNWDIQHALGDIRDAKKLGEYVHQVAPEIVFHMAAQ